MGLLVNGQWQDQWYDTARSKGEFVREAAQLRNWITPDGSPGATGIGGFKAEADRYHLYVSLACPWAHRTLIFRELKGLTDLITVSVVSPVMLENGWTFDKDTGSSGDHLFNLSFMHEVYTQNKSNYSGRVTVPVLWDKHQNCIVSNESSEIIRMFNSAFDEITGNRENFYPKVLQNQIDLVNNRVYEEINNGVYRCGFATSQLAYGQAYARLFQALDWVEDILSKQAYVAGDQITEADWRLFTTLIRFDNVYFGHFKCNRNQIQQFPNLSNYVRQLYQWSGVADTVDMYHIKRHYYYSHTMINPTQVVPEGPEIDYERSHNRG